MDRLLELDEQIQQMQAKIQEYEQNIINRIWTKIRNTRVGTGYKR
jgi:DNA-binding protein YbaB